MRPSEPVRTGRVRTGWFGFGTRGESDFVTEKLYFSGIKGATGGYGLQPVTAEALTERILADRYSVVRQLRDLQRELSHRASGERKVLAMVEFLVKDIVGFLKAGGQAPDTWYIESARKLYTILFGGKSQPLPGDVQILADRLRQEPVEMFTRIVKSLSAGQGSTLAQWLFDQAVGTVGGNGNPAVLRSTLESRFDQALIALRRAHLSDEGPGAVDGQGILRSAWIDGFCRGLDELPVDSLKMLPGIDAIGAPLRTLIQGLGTLNGLRGEGRAAQSEARQRLAALSVVGAFDSWHEIVAGLRGVFMALRRTRQPLRPHDVHAVMRSWLDELRRSITGQLGTVPWVDPKRLEEAGWGIIFAASMSEDMCQSILRALAPLLMRRQQQAGPLYRIYAGRHGYRPGDTASVFLRRPPRNADAANPADPKSTGVPYYLLIVGSPEEIPFEFQFQLDVQYAAGRLDFGDSLEAYHNYASNVVSVEEHPDVVGSQLVFFGTDHPGDTATSLSSTHLVAPLAQHFRARTVGAPWQIVRIAPEKTIKTNLLKILQLTPAPALVFAATHGMEFGADDPRQRDLQGALLCQDWSGKRGVVPPSAYLSAADVTGALNMRGTIVFLFACFGAGTPQTDEYHRGEFRQHATTITTTPFVAALPKAMLALKNRGALAVISHVERLWGLSFLSEATYRPDGMQSRKREHIEVYASAIERLLDGHPVGAALDFFNMRHAAIATELTYLYDRLSDPPSRDDAYRLAELWTANSDARGYVVIGDPAVRLSPPGIAQDQGKPPERDKVG
ncbi:MAG: hypothetical protein MUF84_01085 [Anaerolineae bacterium]|jgi:hypothetical protein|nr:hypothetical protein [Anaerolineae bacterium]